MTPHTGSSATEEQARQDAWSSAEALGDLLAGLDGPQQVSEAALGYILEAIGNSAGILLTESIQEPVICFHGSPPPDWRLSWNDRRGPFTQNLLRAAANGSWAQELPPGTVYPLPFQNETQGFFVLPGGPASEHEKILLDFLLRVTGRALWQARTNQEVQVRATAMANLQIELIRLSFEAQLKDLEVLLVRSLTRLLGAEAGALVLSDEAGESVYIKKTLVQDSHWNYQMIRDVQGSLLGATLNGKEILFAGSLHQDSRYRAGVDSFAGLTPHTIVCVPLQARDRVLGALLFYNLPNGRLSSAHRELLGGIAEVGTQAIEGARLLQRQRVNNADLEASHFELLRSRNTLRALFDSMPAALYIVDKKYKLVAVNMACADRTGQFPSALVGRPCHQALYDLSEPCPECRVLETLTDGQVTARAVRRWTPEEEANEWEISTYPILDEKERVAQAIVLEQDITEKRRLESILAQSEKLAAVGQLAAGVAHEINNPLTAIIANAQILQRELPADDELQESVELIARAGTRATHVVRNLLDFARKERYYMAVTDINETLRKSIDLVEHELVARSIELEFSADPALPRIRASQDHLQGVWLNFLMNAIDAIEGKNGRIGVQTFIDGPSLKVSIRDNGKGIAPERLERIFEPFYTTKAPGRGTGLGLSVCHRVIKQHGGDISVQSRLGEGTEFVVSLPVRR